MCRSHLLWRRGRHCRWHARSRLDLTLDDLLDAPQLAQQILHALESVVTILGEGAADDRLELLRRLYPPVGQPRWLPLRYGGDDIARGTRGERRIAGDHLVQDDAEAPDVGAVIDGLAAHLFRCHVSDRAKHDARLRACYVRIVGGGRVGRDCNLRQAEVEHLDEAVGPHHHILGLDVAMDQTGGVRGVER